MAPHYLDKSQTPSCGIPGLFIPWPRPNTSPHFFVCLFVFSSILPCIGADWNHIQFHQTILLPLPYTCSPGLLPGWHALFLKFHLVQCCTVFKTTPLNLPIAGALSIPSFLQIFDTFSFCSQFPMFNFTWIRDRIGYMGPNCLPLNISSALHQQWIQISSITGWHLTFPIYNLGKWEALWRVMVRIEWNHTCRRLGWVHSSRNHSVSIFHFFKLFFFICYLPQESPSSLRSGTWVEDRTRVRWPGSQFCSGTICSMRMHKFLHLSGLFPYLHSGSEIALTHRVRRIN